LSGLAFTSDNFSEYSGTASFLANVSSNIGGTGNYLTSLYNDGFNANLAQIDSSVLYNGHPTLKYNQPGGTSATPSLQVVFQNGKTLSKLWLRAKIRFSPGFTTTGTLTNSANAYKLLGWGWTTFDGSGRLEITNTNQYDFYWTVISNGSAIGGGSHTSGGTISTEWSDGAWYDYILECDFSQGTSGVARVWMARDGATPILRAATSGTIGAALLPGLDRIALGLNFNQVRTATQTQALWYGQWEVIDGVAHPDPFGLGVQ
jgi:hypothetical protein